MLTYLYMRILYHTILSAELKGIFTDELLRDNAVAI